MLTEIATIAVKAAEVAKTVESVTGAVKDISKTFRDVARPSTDKGFELLKSCDLKSKCDVKQNDSVRPKDFNSDFSNMSIKSNSPEKIKCKNEVPMKQEISAPDNHTRNLSFEERMKIVDAREAETEKLGGSYKEVYRFGEGENTEVHHMPADSISELPRNDGPAIRMEKADHRMTASCGNSIEAREYRAKQKSLINEGKFREALQMDIDDIHDKFGNKYDEGISQMMNYVDNLEKEGKI